MHQRFPLLWNNKRMPNVFMLVISVLLYMKCFRYITCIVPLFTLVGFMTVIHESPEFAENQIPINNFLTDYPFKIFSTSSKLYFSFCESTLDARFVRRHNFICQRLLLTYNHRHKRIPFSFLLLVRNSLPSKHFCFVL